MSIELVNLSLHVFFCLVFLAAEIPKDGEENLLKEAFTRTCGVIFLSPTVLDGRENEFPIKNLNIIDPLKDNNNLGRSVSRSILLLSPA